MIVLVWPVNFSEDLGLNDLRYLRLEFDQLVDKFLNSIAWCYLQHDLQIPWFVRHTLRLLHLNYQKDFTDTSAMLSYLLSPGYFKYSSEHKYPTAPSSGRE